jgi:F420-non-reducing hydrogenase iron-sulfur subunit
MNSSYKPKITVFYCINAFSEKAALPFFEKGAAHVKYVKMACSSMVKDLFILKAFESGADGVVVFACPEEACRYVEGSIRAAKRVARVKTILDDIGLGSERLLIFNTRSGDTVTIEKILTEKAVDLAEQGPLFSED